MCATPTVWRWPGRRWRNAGAHRPGRRPDSIQGGGAGAGTASGPGAGGSSSVAVGGGRAWRSAADAAPHEATQRLPAHRQPGDRQVAPGARRAIVQSARVASDAEHLAGARTSDETRRDVNLLTIGARPPEPRGWTARRDGTGAARDPLHDRQTVYAVRTPCPAESRASATQAPSPARIAIACFEDIFRGPRSSSGIATQVPGGDRRSGAGARSGLWPGEFLDLLRESGHRYRRCRCRSRNGRALSGRKVTR